MRYQSTRDCITILYNLPFLQRNWTRQWRAASDRRRELRFLIKNNETKGFISIVTHKSRSNNNETRTRILIRFWNEQSTRNRGDQRMYECYRQRKMCLCGSKFSYGFIKTLVISVRSKNEQFESACKRKAFFN